MTRIDKWITDYLKIFELHQENHTNKLIVIQRQEEPEQKRKVAFHLGKYSKRITSTTKQNLGN